MFTAKKSTTVGTFLVLPHQQFGGDVTSHLFFLNMFPKSFVLLHFS